MEQTTEETQIEEKAEKTEKQIVDAFFKEKEQYQQASRTHRDEINDIYSAYIGQITDVKDTSKSQEKIMKLRTEVSYIVPSIFSGQPEIEVEGVGEEDKDFAYVAEKIINYRFETITQFYEKIEAWVKQATVFGTSILRIVWRFKTQDNGDGTATPIQDEPDLEVPNILDSFYNPIIPEIENQKPIFRSVLPIEQVKDNPMYDFKDQFGVLNRTKLESKGNSSANPYDSSQQVSSDSIDQQKAGEGTIEVYEQLSGDKILTVADGKERLVLRSVDNPDKMITAVKLIHEPNCIPNRFDGFGVGHNTLGIGTLYQKLSNRLLDTINLSNNIFTLFAKGTKIDKKQLNVKAGGGAEVDTQGKPMQEVVHIVQFPDIKQGAINFLNKIDDDHKRASGANDLLQGAASNRTLGQDQIASTYSSNRFELINRRFKQALADVARIILKMELSRIQSVDAEILRIFPLEAEIVNGQIKYSRETVYQMLISDEAKNAKFNIKVKGQTNVAKNKDIQIKQLMEAFNVFGKVIPPANQLAWAKKVLELRGIDEIDELIPDADALQPQTDPITGQPMQGMQGQPMDAGMGQGMTPQQPMI